jgi:hypothetical protein
MLHHDSLLIHLYVNSFFIILHESILLILNLILILILLIFIHIFSISHLNLYYNHSLKILILS